MSQRVKKAISILLALLMIAAVLTGCSSSSGGSSSTPAASSEPSSAATAAAQAKSDDPTDPSNASIDWQQCAGTELRVMMCTHFFQAAIEEKLPEFEALTGIKVKMENYEENEFWNKLLVEFNSGSTVDAFMMNYTNEAVYDSGGWIEDLNPYIDNAKLTDKEWYAPDDFLASAVDFGTYNDHYYGVPVTGEWQILFYRTDLYEKYNLTVPTTMDDLYANCKTIQEGESGMSGIVMRGARNSSMWWPWAGFVRDYGAQWVTDGKCTLNTPEAAAATSMYVKLLTDCGPSGYASYTYLDALTDFEQGKSAHFIDSSGFMANMEDTENSLVAGKTGYALMPAAAKGADPVPNVNHWMLSIGKQSQNKDAAWLFLEWATSKSVAKDVALTNGSTARTSIWQDKDFLSKYPEQWAQVSLDSAKYADKNCIPCLPESAELGEYVETTVTSLYEGGDVTTALQDLTDQSNALLGK